MVAGAERLWAKYLVRKAEKEAFEVALQGGKHAGFLKSYLNMSNGQLQKGIKSIKKQIAEHYDKIANPEKHIKDWKNLDPRQRDALLNKKWPGDIARQKEQLGILKQLLKRK